MLKIKDNVDLKELEKCLYFPQDCFEVIEEKIEWK